MDCYYEDISYSLLNCQCDSCIWYISCKFSSYCYLCFVCICCSALLYLNSNFVGGNFFFTHQNMSIQVWLTNISAVFMQSKKCLSAVFYWQNLLKYWWCLLVITHGLFWYHCLKLNWLIGRVPGILPVAEWVSPRYIACYFVRERQVYYLWLSRYIICALA